VEVEVVDEEEEKDEAAAHDRSQLASIQKRLGELVLGSTHNKTEARWESGR